MWKEKCRRNLGHGQMPRHWTDAIFFAGAVWGNNRQFVNVVPAVSSGIDDARSQE